MNASDWLSRSNDDFVRAYAPHAASRRENNLAPARGRPPSTPSSSLPGPAGLGLGIVAAGPSRQQPYQPKFHSQEINMQFDFANLPSQIDRRAAIQTMMNQPHDTVVTYAGRQMFVSEALKQMMNERDPATVHIPQNSAGRLGPNDPGRQPQVAQGYPPAGPRIQISQAATDALSPAQYEEFQRTGGIEGLTGPVEGVRVHVRNSSGTVESRFSFNPESGAVEAGRDMDMRLFQDPNAGDK